MRAGVYFFWSGPGRPRVAVRGDEASGSTPPVCFSPTCIVWGDNSKAAGLIQNFAMPVQHLVQVVGPTIFKHICKMGLEGIVSSAAMRATCQGELNPKSRQRHVLTREALGHFYRLCQSTGALNRLSEQLLCGLAVQFVADRFDCADVSM
jgi:hypothetical protein